MPRLLITGASGLLGWHLCRYALRDWQVVGTCCSHPLKLEHVQTEQADLAELHQLDALLRRIRPDAVVHAAAMSKPDWCQQHEAESERVNVAASIRIAEWCGRQRVPCVFTSTDLVFDGRRGNYTEQDVPNPLNIYGQQKLRAESGMREVCAGVTVCRMPLMYGPPSPHSSGFVAGMFSAARRGEPIRAFVDEYRTPLNVLAACKALLLMLEKRPPLVHLGGGQRVSRYRMAEIIVQALQADPGVLVSTRQADVATAAPRPADVSLNNRLARSLGFQPPDLEQDLRALAQSAQN